MNADRIVGYGCCLIAAFALGVVAAQRPQPEIPFCRVAEPLPRTYQPDCKELKWQCSTQARMEKIKLPSTPTN